MGGEHWSIAPVSGTMGVCALLAYDPCVRRVYQPAALPRNTQRMRHLPEQPGGRKLLPLRHVLRSLPAHVGSHLAGTSLLVLVFHPAAAHRARGALCRDGDGRRGPGGGAKLHVERVRRRARRAHDAVHRPGRDATLHDADQRRLPDRVCPCCPKAAASTSTATAAPIRSASRPGPTARSSGSTSRERSRKSGRTWRTPATPS